MEMVLLAGVEREEIEAGFFSGGGGVLGETEETHLCKSKIR